MGSIQPRRNYSANTIQSGGMSTSSNTICREGGRDRGRKGGRYREGGARALDTWVLKIKICERVYQLYIL